MVELALPPLRDCSDKEELPAVLGEHWLFVLRTKAIDSVYRLF